MKVKVLSVQPTIAPNSHEVLLSVGTDRYKFIFTTEVNRVGEHLLQTTHGDRAFSDMFRFNQRVARQVTNLVVKCYNNQAVEFPSDVGVFVTPEVALSKQKPFESGTLVETDSQQPEESNRETRQKAIAIVEKLPEAMLDEAVKFLESLSVKANLVE
ncbi:hypothetical protein [Microcoleus sp. CAWBG58]|uniref:hypothetical protein n=1 Tax=Microcoleus sp. CAWBG58 TaxID=2841651 RepID=UPI0025FEC1B5|nr:hypothetical protein [Microcoleus sp. CAWBG58]